MELNRGDIVIVNLYPKITLKEINYLFPNLIPESLINIENRNESIIPQEI